MTQVSTGPQMSKAEWQPFASKYVTVYAQAASTIHKRAAEELRQAVGVVEMLVKILEPAPENRTEHVHIYLLETPDSTLATIPAKEQVILRYIYPEATNESVTLPLTRLLVPHWFGQEAAGAKLVLEGLAGVVAARLKLGPTTSEANTWVRNELEAGRSVSIFTTPAVNAETIESNKVATSFVSYLLQNEGGKTLRHFLQNYDSSRQDQAALSAYQKSLGALEEEWLDEVKHPARNQSTFGLFFSQLGPLLRPYRRRLIEVALYMILGLSFSLLLPLGGKFLVDNVIPSGNLGFLAFFILGLLVVYVTGIALQLRRIYVNNWIIQNILTQLQDRMFSHLQKLSHNFYTDAKVGDIVNRFTGDIQAFKQSTHQVLSVGAFQLINIIAAIITIVILNPLLGAIVLGVIPVFFICYIILGLKVKPVGSRYADLNGQAAATVQENISAHTVVKAFGLEERSAGAFRNTLNSIFQVYLRLVVVGSLFEASISLATTFGQLIVLGLGGFLVISKEMSLGTLVAFIGLMPTLFQPMAALSTIGQQVQAATGSMERIQELMEETVEVQDKPEAKSLPPFKREIKLEQVTFSYSPDQPILKNLNLSIRAGTHVAIVGPSGSGKSTIINMLLRFWDPDSGSVRFDGCDLRDITITSLRRQLGLVFQDTFVFDTSIRENIAVGLLGATDAEIVAAARAARLDTYIESLPAKYDTVVGERGIKMSGGQRQRLAIARALLRNPAVLILDEATSALDAKTESEILETLKSVTQGRTTISITHRLSLAASADHIIVLDKGQVLEQGNHAQLIQNKGLYQQLYREQTGYFTTSQF